MPKTKKTKKTTKANKKSFSQLHEPVDFKRPWRIFKIMAEFVEGYDFVNKMTRTVTILGSARTKSNQKYYKEAVKLGKLLAKGKYATLTGAGPGIMEAGNKGAFEANGKSLGINIELPFEQVLNPYVKEAKGFNYFFTRKTMLLSPAQAFVFFPGGYGTMDEFFEVFDYMELGELQRAPMILVGRDFWRPIVDFMANQEIKHGIIDYNTLNKVHVVETAEEAYEIVKQSKPVKNVCKLAASNFACEQEINWRVFKIMAELVEGFDTVTSTLDDVTVLGSKSIKEESEYYHQAYRLGLELGRNKRTVITGGGPGINEAANKGAKEAGTQSLGLLMTIGHEVKANPYLTSSTVFHFPFTRKLILTAPSNAFIVFPGGLGTMHQLFELLTLMQTGKARKIPVILFDKEFWKPIDEFIKTKLLKKYKTISSGDEKLYRIVDSIDEAMKIIKKIPRESDYVKKVKQRAAKRKKK